LPIDELALTAGELVVAFCFGYPTSAGFGSHGASVSRQFGFVVFGFAFFILCFSFRFGNVVAVFQGKDIRLSAGDDHIFLSTPLPSPFRLPALEVRDMISFHKGRL